MKLLIAQSKGDLKQDKSYDFSISITYKASTSLPSGALVEGKGQSIVQMKDGETTCVVKEYGACVLNSGIESTLTPEMTEQMLGKCEVLAKFYKKKMHATGFTAIGYCPRKNI